MAAAAIQKGIQYAPQIIAGLETANNLGSKYIPKVRKIANAIFNPRTRKSASDYIRKSFGSAKGFQGLIKDIGKRAGQASRYLTSGKGLKAISDVSSDVGAAIGAAEGITGQKFGSARKALAQGSGQAKQFHNTLNQYNEQAKQLASQWDRSSLGGP